jgi:hypothetical protein
MNTEIKRQQADDIQRRKEMLNKKANLRNLSLDDLETQKALVNGIKKMPQSKVIDQAQQLEHSILPSILAKAGGNVNDTNYVFWRGVLDSLNWLLHITDYSIRLEERISREKHQNEYLRTLAVKLQRELDNYSTMERFITNDLVNSYLGDKEK